MYCTIFYGGGSGVGDDEVEEDNNESDGDDDQEDAKVEQYLEGDEGDEDDEEEVEEYPEGGEDPLPADFAVSPPLPSCALSKIGNRAIFDVFRQIITIPLLFYLEGATHSKSKQSEQKYSQSLQKDITGCRIVRRGHVW